MEAQVPNALLPAEFLLQRRSGISQFLKEIACLDLASYCDTSRCRRRLAEGSMAKREREDGDEEGTQVARAPQVREPQALDLKP